jgi:hypothetical protein
MANDLIDFIVIQKGIQKIRDRAETGIKRITADFLVNNFYEDIEAMRKRGYRFDEIIDELHLLLAETIPEKAERDKMFAIKPGTLKVYMSRKRQEIAETETTKKPKREKALRKDTGKKTKSETSKPKENAVAFKVNSTPKATNSANVPTGRARATDLDREI